MNITYTPVKSVREFLVSEAFISAICGPIGSSKTTAAIFKTIYHAKRMAPCTDGIRRSRAVWIRNCYDPQTEILTRTRGWVRFAELNQDDEVATRHGDRLVFERPRLLYAARHTGKMLGFKSEQVDLLVTPDHELWTSARYGRKKDWRPYAHVKAQEIYGCSGTHRCVATADWQEGVDPGVSVDFCEFLGFWFADGSAAEYGKASTKRIPAFVMQAPKQHIQAFLRGYQNGDGTFAKPGVAARLRTTSAVMASQLQELAVKAGLVATLHKNLTPRPGLQPLYWLTLHTEKKAHPALNKRGWYTVEDYDDMVYCVEVSTHVVLVRRNGKAVWCGQTKQQLDDTSIPDWLKWMPDGQAGVFMKTGMKYLLKFDDVELEVLFRGLDEQNDVRRLLSLQASFAILDEAREISPDIFEAVQGRLGRYPDGMLVPHKPSWGTDGKGNPIQGCVTDEGKSNAHVWVVTNPPDFDTYWERFLSDPPSTAKVWFQPSGLSTEADWIHLLPPDYYETVAEGKSQDWIAVYVNGEFGKSLAGAPVFRSFKLDYHVSKTPLRAIRMAEYPLLIGHDFGLCPAVTISQLDVKGRLLTFADLTSEGMGVLRFLREKLKPLLASRFAGIHHVVIGDPAGVQRSQTDERSVFEVVKSEGFKIIPAKSNTLTSRISSVDSWLNRTIDSGPACLIDPSCKQLIGALRGGYRYRLKQNGEVDEKPEKNSFSHVADAFQYSCMHADGGAFGGGLLSQQRRREIKRVNYYY